MICRYHLNCLYSSGRSLHILLRTHHFICSGQGGRGHALSLNRNRSISTNRNYLRRQNKTSFISLSNFQDRQKTLFHGWTTLSGHKCGLLSANNSNVTIIACSKEVPAILQSSSVDEILKFFEDQNVRQSIPVGDLGLYLLTLQKAFYFGLAHIPWLHRDTVAIAYIQLRMNDKLKEFGSSMTESEGFKLLLAEVEERLNRCEDEDYSQILLSLLYLGVDEGCLLIRNLLLHLNNQIPQLNIHGLSCVTSSLRCLQSRYFHLMPKIIARLGELFDQADTNELVTLDSIDDLCKAHMFVSSIIRFASNGRWGSILLKLVKKHLDDLDINTLCTYVRYVHHVNLSERQAVPLVTRKFQAMINDTKSHHIAQMAYSLKRMKEYTGDIVGMLQKRSFDLIDKDDLQVREVANVLPAFTQDISPQLSYEVCRLMCKHIKDADVMILTNFADIMVDLDLQDSELLSMYQDRVLEEFHLLSPNISRQDKVLNLLTRQPIRDEIFSPELYEEILRVFNDKLSYRVGPVCTIAKYVLANVRTVIPYTVMDKVINVVPQMRANYIGDILNILDSIPHPRGRQLHNQVLELRTILMRDVSEKIQNVTNLDFMIHMVNDLYIRRSKRDLILLERLMSRFTDVTKRMTKIQFKNLVYLFLWLPTSYYHMEVFEDCVNFAQQNQDNLTFTAVSNLVRVISRAGYSPHQLDTFGSMCVKKLKEELDRNHFNILNIITFAVNLCHLQLFPEDCLSRIFTFEFLGEVDTMMEGNPQMRKSVERLMMVLNRSIVLEAPYLDIPWFHGDYFEDRYQNKKMTRFEDEVYATLEKVLGGSQYIQRNVSSSYHHEIDFEFMINANGTVVPYDAIDSEKQSHQRVAVLLMPESKYCCNTPRLLGMHLSICRQLEILGYKIIQVPYFDWQSMALSDKQAKVEYLHRKIKSL